MTVGDAETAADALSIEWTDSAGTVLSTDAADASGVATYTATDFAPGDHTVTIMTDADGFSHSASITITVNAAPSAPVVSLSPVAPTPEDLEAIIDVASVDPEAARSPTPTSGRSTAHPRQRAPRSFRQAHPAGENWSVNVIPNDGMMDGTGAGANVTIANAAWWHRLWPSTPTPRPSATTWSATPPAPTPTATP